MSLKYSKGFGLTEGLIAMVILSSGLLAIYGVHTSYLKSFADDRAKADMTSKMVAYLTKARSMGTCSAISESAPSYLTVSATAVSAADDTACDVTISGAWSSSLSDGSRVVHSKIFLRDLKLSDDDEFQEGDGVTEVGFLNPPTGDAVYGDGTSKGIDEGENGNLVQRDKLFGTAVIEEGGVYYLLDPVTGDKGTNVLESSNPFYRIKGTIYASENGVKNFTYKEEDIFAGAPDISICKTAHTFKSQDGYPVAIPYQCYVGAGWYGRIGIVENNDSDTLLDKDSCVGSPSNSDDGTDYSRHAQGSLARRYTKYELVSVNPTATLNYVSGAGDTSDDLEVREYIEIGTPQCETKEAYISGACTLSNHDFMVVEGYNKASPTEAENAANCVTNMTTISGASFSLAANFESAVSAGEYSFYPVSGSSVSDISNNPGSYYCLGGENGSSVSGGEVVCPEFTDAPYIATNTTFDVFVWAKKASGNGYEQISTDNFDSVKAKGLLDSDYVDCVADNNKELFVCGDKTGVAGSLVSAVALDNGVYKPRWTGEVIAVISNTASINCVGLDNANQTVSGSQVTVEYSITAQGEDERLDLENLVANSCTKN